MYSLEIQAVLRLRKNRYMLTAGLNSGIIFRKNDK
jgi:hypothetical protein